MKTLLALFASFFRWLANWSDPEAVARRDKVAQDKETIKAVQEVIRKDEDAVNNRLKKHLPLLFIGFFLMAGCVRTVYIEETDRVIPLEHNGKPGWWVPEGRFAQIMERLEAKEKEK